MDSERVILIKGDHSKWYDQAIFIVKKNIPQNKIPVDFVAEAEKIINGYVGVGGSHALATTRRSTEKRTKKSSNFDLFLNLIMLGSCLVLAGILLWTFK